MTRVPFLDLGAAVAEVRPELDEAWRTVVEGGRFVLGPEVDAFEAEFATYCGAAHCVGVGNGYDALVLGLRALGVGPGDDVLVAANTYVATWLAVSAVGARPVGVEPDDTGNLDPARLDDAATARTSAVVPVHLYGQPAAMDQILAWAHRRGAAVLADAAHADGARYRGAGVGALGDAAAWSFYPSKNLGALGDGGAVTTDDGAVARRVRMLHHYGSERRNENELLGVNSRLDELQAALLRVKLRHLDEWNARRARRAQRYLESLVALGAERTHETSPIATPRRLPDIQHAWHLFTVLTPHRDDLRRHLAGAGVETLVHYPTPPFAQPAYSSLGVGPGTFPRTRAWAGQVLSLPLGPHLTDDQQQVVVAALSSFTPSAPPRPAR